MDLHFRTNMAFFTLPLLFLCSFPILTPAVRDLEFYDLEAAPSIAADYKVQAVESNNKYGYPYRIAPTLTPVIQARADDDESDASREKLPVAKHYGTRITSEDNIPVKKGHLKKAKIVYASRRQDSDDASMEKRFRSYVQPKYRNNDELEKDFQPRRMDIDIPYSQYSYPRPSRSRKPKISPIDPYLTPSAGHEDSFYPVPKVKTYPSSSYGHNYDGPSYGAGKYEEPIHYHDSSYGGPSNYPSSGGPSSSYSSSGGSSPSYPSSGGPASYTNDYHENYAIKSNEPIIGSIRKRLLDYAGATDLYEGEPDYLRQVTRNKYKYGNLGNDYYSYGGPLHRDSYSEFPYVESKISLIKKSRRV